MSSQSPVISVMTLDPHVVGPEATLEEARSLMEKHLIRHLPVVDQRRKLVGIVSATDFSTLDRLGPQKDTGCSSCDPRSGLTVGEFMTREVITLAPDDTLGLAADLFLSRMFHAAPVIDEGELVGIVTCHDLLRYAFSDVLPLQSAKAA